MKLICEFRAMVYGIVGKEIESRDGKDNVKYYQAHIRQGKDMTTVSISADAAIQVEKELMKEQYLQCEYDTERGKLRILGIVANPFNNKPAPTNAPKA